MPSTWQKDYLRYKEFFLNIVRVYNTKPDLKIYLELVLSLITVSVFAFFAIKPTVITIIDLNKEIAEKERVSSELKKKLSNLQTADFTMQNEIQRLVFVDQAIPPKASPEILIKQLESLATSKSLKIMNIAISDTIIVGKSDEVKKLKDEIKFSDNTTSLPLIISVSGDYTNLRDFLTDIENLRRPIKINSLSITSNVSENQKTLVLTIAGVTPYYQGGTTNEK